MIEDEDGRIKTEVTLKGLVRLAVEKWAKPMGYKEEDIKTRWGVNERGEKTIILTPKKGARRSH
jgi:hypothetical protein